MVESSDVGSNQDTIVSGDIQGANYIESYAAESDDSTCNYVVTPGFTKYWFPKCAYEMKPRKDQFFTTLEEGIGFYSEYARICGFDIRRATKKTYRGRIVLKMLLCNRAGMNDSGNKRISSRDIDDGGSCTSSSRIKKTVSRRCGCKAMLGLKLNKNGAYAVYVFVERHNHRLAMRVGRQFMRSSRLMSFEQQRFVFDAAKVQIGASQAHHLMKEMAGGFENVGATVTEFWNFNRDLKQGIGDKDAQIVLDKLQAKKGAHSGFYFEFDKDCLGHLTKLFWADPVGRRNYKLFGDVISFDATFGTNKKCVTFAAGLLSKEDIVHYTWVFHAFLKAMGHEPLCIITDQCPAMRQAVPAIFTTAKHRWCMWHIMKKLSTKVGPAMCMNSDFMSKIKHFVWAENLEVLEFEEGWKSVMDEFGLTSNDWMSEMYDYRERWIPAYFRDDRMAGILRTTSWSESANSFFGKYNMCKDTLTEFFVRFETAMEKQRNVNARLNDECLTSLPKMDTPLLIEKHAAEVYTREIFNRMQEQIKQACFVLRIKSMICEDGVNILLVKDPLAKGKEYEARQKLEDNFIWCSCKLFERIGILCSHGFLALKQADVNKLPKELVLNRWSKNAEMKAASLFPEDVSAGCSSMEKFRAKMNDISYDFNSCMGLVGSNSEDLDYVASVIKELKHELRARRGTNVITSKKDIIQNLICSDIPEITVRPPTECRNKGCGRKRIVGEVEKAIVQSEKPKRMCKGCNEMANHDKRNCPILYKGND